MCGVAADVTRLPRCSFRLGLCRLSSRDFDILGISGDNWRNAAEDGTSMTSDLTAARPQRPDRITRWILTAIGIYTCLLVILLREWLGIEFLPGV
jgi:hypothetical protein